MIKRYVLIDGNALVHAAWHGYPEKIGTDGLSYRAIHGFLSKLHRLDRQCQWDDLFIIFDPAEGSLYRKKLYPDYKSHRPANDPDLVRQMLLIQEVLFDLGITTLKVPGVESDDVIGTLSTQLKSMEDCLIMIVTPDKDMAQLVDERVGLLRPVRGPESLDTPFDYISIEGVISKFGVQPHQIPAWLALIGDVSDNIPGVPGIGPKKATHLLEKYGDLSTIMTHSETVGGKVGEALIQSRTYIETTLKLTTIQTQLPTDDWIYKRSTFNQTKLDQWANLAGFPYWMGYYDFNSMI